MYQRYRDRHTSATPTLDIQLNIGPETEISASRLAIFGGQTRVMSSKLLTRRRPNKRSSQSVSTSSPGPSATSGDTPSRDSSPPVSTAASSPSDSGSSVPQNVSDAFAQVHPSLVEYLSLFPASASLAVVDPPPEFPMDASSPGNIAPQSPINYPQQGMNGLNGAAHNGLNGAAVNGAGMNGVSMNGAGMNGSPASFQAMFPDLSGRSSMGPGMASGGGGGASANMDFFAGAADPNIAALSMPDLGFTEDVMMTEHWMNLMRQTGIMDSNGGYAALSNGQSQPTQGQQPFMSQQSAF